MTAVKELKHVTPLFLEADIIRRCEETGHNYVWVARTLWMSRVEQLESLTPTIPLYCTCGAPCGQDAASTTGQEGVLLVLIQGEKADIVVSTRIRLYEEQIAWFALHARGPCSSV